VCVWKGEKKKCIMRSNLRMEIIKERRNQDNDNKKSFPFATMLLIFSSVITIL
jgi:hypothetical protein